MLPLFLREIGRDLAARRRLDVLLRAEGAPGAGLLEPLDSLRDRYRAALAPPVPACSAYVNDPDDGTGYCDTCGNTRAEHS